ncbi:MAG TPA: hypothetical protein VLI55_11030 [Bryobacteraceae bacterium]|nr:hypothetical protein [Bryobacteraceae bacterium]HXF15331.1 hypothetical protein [Terriglobales bacterium]
MDAAYDARQIDAHSRSLGHVPLIAPNGATVPIPKRRQDSLRHYDKRRKMPTRRRTAIWVANHGRACVQPLERRVRGALHPGAQASRIMAHLMFGVLALTVDQLLKLTG